MRLLITKIFNSIEDNETILLVNILIILIIIIIRIFISLFIFLLRFMLFSYIILFLLAAECMLHWIIDFNIRRAWNDSHCVLMCRWVNIIIVIVVILLLDHNQRAVVFCITSTAAVRWFFLSLIEVLIKMQWLHTVELLPVCELTFFYLH